MAISLNGLEFKFKIKLQKLSIISLATYLWKLPSIKKEISSFFESNIDCSSRCKNWGQIVEKVFNNFKLMANDDLPAHLKLEMNDGIFNIGDKILQWIIYLTEDRRFDFSFAEDIYFTYYGVIDEEKIFQYSWSKNSVFISRNDFERYDVLPCLCVQEDYIDKNKDKMMTWSMCYPLDDILDYTDHEDEVYLIITSGICCYINSRRSHFVIPKPYRNLIQKFTSRGIKIEPKDMFQISVSVGLHKAVEYFLEKMDDFTLEKEILPALNLCLKKIELLTKLNLIYLKEKYIEILLNLLNRVPENERSSFILKHQREILLLLLNHPFQNFYVLVLEKTAKSLSNYSCNLVVLRLTKYIVKDCKSPCPIKRHMNKMLLQMTWCRIDDHKKGFIHRESTIASILFTQLQFPILRLLINIRDLPDGLEFKDLAVYKRLRTCIKQGKLDTLNKFVKELFSSEDEVEIFKIKMLDCFDVLIEEDLFKKAELFLHWLASPDKNKQFYKNQIDDQRILRKLITKGKLGLANIFLKWRFDTEAERENCKTLLRNDEVIQAKINEVLSEPEDWNVPFNLLEWLGSSDTLNEDFVSNDLK